MLIEVKDKDFEKLIPESNEKPIVVYFWAHWATGSTFFMPKVDRLAHKMHKNIKFVSIDTEENKQTIKKYQIRTIPTVLIIKNEEVSHTLTGLINEDHIKEAVKKHI